MNAPNPSLSSAQSPQRLAEAEHARDASLQTCEAMMVCLQPRRFVIVRADEPQDLWPLDGGWEKIRDLKEGDRVVYRGKMAVVRAVEVYR